MKRSHVLGMAVALALGVAACGPKEEPKKEAAKPATPPPPAGVTVKIAHAGPLTGSIAHLGKDDENGVALAVAQLNSQKIQIDGKPVTFSMQSEDDQADPKTGATVAQKLVDAKVAAVIGHLNSGVSIPASEIYSKAGIPMISGSATNPTLTERGMKTVFRTVGRDDQQGPAIASYIANELKGKKVAIVDDKTAYGEGIANEVEKTLKGAKVAVVGRERTTDKETDFKAILTKIKAKNPDVVFHGGMDATGGPMLKQARELGIKATFAFGDGACTDEMAKLAGTAAEGLVCSQAGLPREAASKEFVDAFKGKYGEIKQYAPYFYDATLAVAEAMKKANSVDPAKFTPEIFNVTFKGATGNVAFDAKGDRKDAEMTIFKLQGGKVVPVAIVKGGQTTPFKMDAPAAAPAADAKPAAAPADAKPADGKPADAPKSGFGPFPEKKAEPKKEEVKK
jgi:branched-chain amino acid transport system substrate-binding protein